MLEYAELVAKKSQAVRHTHDAILPKPLSEILKDFDVPGQQKPEQQDIYMQEFLDLVATKIELRGK